MWTGFLWDTVKFKLFVPEAMLVKVEGILEELWKVRKKSEEVQRMARVAGVKGVLLWLWVMWRGFTRDEC